MKHEDLKEKADQFILEIEKSISTNSYSIQSVIDKLKELDFEVRDFVVHTLGFSSINLLDEFSDTKFKNVSDEIFKDHPIQEIKVFFDYLVSTNYFKDDYNSFQQKRIFDIVPPENKKDLLLYYFNDDSPIVSKVGALLAETEEGINALVNIIYDDSKKELHTKAALAICENLIPEIADRHNYVNNDYYSKNTSHSKNTVDALKKLISFPNNNISYLAAKTLYYASLLSVEDIEKIFKATDERKTLLGLKCFERFRIDAESCKPLFSVVVELLEDKNIKVSEAAIDAIQYFSNWDSDTIAENIIELLVLRSTNRPQEFFNVRVVTSALKVTFKFNPRLQGQILYRLRDLAFKNTGNTQGRAVFTGVSISKKEFLSLVNELKETNPKIASSIANIVSGSLESAQIVKEISETDPKDIQQNAANQLNLLTRYYESGLAQAKNSFNWAIGITVFCVLSFLTVVFIFGQNEDKTIIWLSAFASGIAEIIAGTLLVIYRQSLSQLNNYNQQMSKIQNYLLANSFIESLSNEAKDNARLELIKSVAIGQTSPVNIK